MVNLLDELQDEMIVGTFSRECDALVCNPLLGVFSANRCEFLIARKQCFSFIHASGVDERADEMADEQAALGLGAFLLEYLDGLVLAAERQQAVHRC
jgi:hypothetical protein